MDDHTGLARYRPPDYDRPTGPYSRWSFHIEPQVERRADCWAAWYPGEDWSVTAAGKDEALQQLMDEFSRRMSSGNRFGEYVDDYTDRLCRRHLHDPVQGVYAMDVGVCNQLRETESDADIRRAFREAEEKRVQGLPYTKEDYLRNRDTRRAADQAE